jgi:hypothetical protein
MELFPLEAIFPGFGVAMEMHDGDHEDHLLAGLVDDTVRKTVSPATTRPF